MKNEVSRELVERIVERCKLYLTPQLIYVFGSVVKGNVVPQSDIDIAFLSQKDYTSYEIFMFAQELADIARRDIDLIDLSKVSTVFRAQIISTGELLYAYSEKFRDEYEIRILKEYSMLNEERKVIIDKIMEEKRIYE